MSNYKINLARAYTRGKTFRCRSYWRMVLYFCLCGALIIHAAGQAAQTFMQIKSQKKAITALQRDFKIAHPGEPSMKGFVDQLESTLAAQKTKLDLLLKEIRQPVPLGECLFRFAEDLPPGMRLAGLEIDPELSKNQFSASFYIPPGRESQEAPIQWVTTWKEDEEISKFLQNITLEERKDNVKVGDELLTQFTCTAKYQKGGAQ